MKKWISLLAVAAMAYTPVHADVLVDDFENAVDSEKPDGANQTALGATFNYYKSSSDKFYEAGYWYAYNDEDNGGGDYSKGNSGATPDYMTDTEFELGLGGDESNGYVALTIQLGDDTDKDGTAFYGFGCNLTVDKNFTDMSKLSAVEFYAAGEGSMNVKFVTKKTSTYSWGDMVSQFDLSSSWEKVTVPVADIAPEPWSDAEGDEVTWDDCKSEVTKLHFQTNGDDHKGGDAVKFAVDNISFIGMDLTDFEWGENTVQTSDVTAGAAPDGTPVFEIGSSVADAKVVTSNVELGDAYPNPFNPVTTINFALPTAEKVSLKVFDAAGNLVKTLYNGVTATQSVNWNATNTSGAKVASGVYFYRLTSGSKVVTKKMVLLK